MEDKPRFALYDHAKDLYLARKPGRRIRFGFYKGVHNATLFTSRYEAERLVKTKFPREPVEVVRLSEPEPPPCGETPLGSDPPCLYRPQ